MQVHVTYLILGVCDSILANEFELGKLQQLVCVGDTFKDGTQVFESFVVADRGQSSEGVSLARSVTFGFQESLEELRRVGHHSLVVLKDGSNCKDGILADVGMTVLKTGSCGGQQGLDQLGIAQLAQES